MAIAPGVLCFGGLDPSGGAGILADAEAVRAAGARPLCVATAITVQTTRAVKKWEAVSAGLIGDCAHALLLEENVRGVKIGMICDAKIAKVIFDLLQHRRDLPIVVDPVLQATSGTLLFKGSLQAARDSYLALAHGAVLTPNLAEAQVLLDGPPDARALVAKGPKAVLLKGGHLPGDPVDVFATAEGGFEEFRGSRIKGTARGTGCRLASAMAAGLARGVKLRDAVMGAREFVRGYLQRQAV
jgi:hydroxymethylpyrimidine/phosphomethylpyrimidine kinase